MDKQTPIRVGIVGCGYQGGMLAQAIGRTKSLQVTACADPDQKAAAQVARLAGNVAVYGSSEALLHEATVDAVMVATSHDLLYETALAALRAGKHVLAEKPIGMDEKEAAQLEAAVQETGLCFMAGYSFRYIAALQKVHELLQANAVGEILTVSGAIGVGPMSSGWQASPETGGGPLLFVGSHLVDAMLWYAQDDPVVVVADVRYRADTRADETTTFQLQFARGVVAQGMVTQTATSFFHNLDIYGRQVRISLRGVDLHYTIDIVSRVLPAYAQPATLHIPQVDDLLMLMLLPQLTEFAQAIHERRPPAVTVTDGRRVLKVLDATIKSDRTGETSAAWIKRCLFYKFTRSKIMTTAESRAFIQRYAAAINGKAKPASVVNQYVADADEALKQHIADGEAAVPHYEFIAEELIIENDKVVIRFAWRGTHLGSFMGIPATGRQINVPGIIIYRLARDKNNEIKIVEHWMQVDSAALMQQLGVSA